MPVSYQTDKIIKEICACLIERGEPLTPSSIARCINTSPRTAQRYIEIAKNLGILECDEVRMGRNKVQLCRISKKYFEIFKERWKHANEE